MPVSVRYIDQAEEVFAEELEKERATQNTTTNQDLNEIALREEIAIAPRAGETSLMKENT